MGTLLIQRFADSILWRGIELNAVFVNLGFGKTGTNRSRGSDKAHLYP